MTNILFGVIGLLMFTITGIGFAEVKTQMGERDMGSVSGVESRAVAETVVEDAVSQNSSAYVSSEDSVVRALADVTEQVVTAVSTSASDLVFGSDDDKGEDEWEAEDEDEDEDDEGEHRSRSSGVQAANSAATAPATVSTNTSAQPSVAAGSFTMAQIATHNSAASCYTVVSGIVYDVTSYISRHPGGQSAIKSICGVDGSAAFSGQHGGQSKPTNTLASFKIGTLAQ